MVSAFILGLFWKRANATGAFVSLISGGIFAIFMILSASYDIWPYLNEFHFLAKANILFLISVLIHVAVSLSTAEPEVEKVAEYTYRKELFTSETEELAALPWYQNYRYLAVILLTVTTGVVIWFW